MPGVWRSGCDAGIAARGVDPLVGERRIIVGMDEIVGYSWMLRVLLEQLFQNGCRLKLVGVALVGLWCGCLQCQRVVCPGLEIVGIALGHLLHCLRVSE